MIVPLLLLIAALALTSLVTQVRWISAGTDGRPRAVDPTRVGHPPLYGRARTA